jgi:hypothetical protein
MIRSGTSTGLDAATHDVGQPARSTDSAGRPHPVAEGERPIGQDREGEGEIACDDLAPGQDRLLRRVGELIRSHPLLAVGAGIASGWLIATMSRAIRSDQAATLFDYRRPARTDT